MTKWNKVRSKERLLETPITKFLEKLKDLKSQLETETERLRQAMEAEKSKSKEQSDG